MITPINPMAMFHLANLLLLSSTVSASLGPYYDLDANNHRQQQIAHGIKWLQEGTSVLVHIDTPDLPLWNVQENIGENVPSALLLNFTMQDRRVLLLNDVPILPMANAFVPPRIKATQTALTLEEFQFEFDALSDFHTLPSFDLDYYRVVFQGEHPSTRYNIYNPTLLIDILGVGISRYETLLLNQTQRSIVINLAELEPYQKYPYDTPIFQRFYNISDVTLRDRYPYNPRSHPETLESCTIWSWICSDVHEYPWYRFVYRESFDEFGKIGSLRHALLKRYDTLCQRVGRGQAAVWCVIVILGFLLLPVYGVIALFRRMQTFFEGNLGAEVDRHEIPPVYGIVALFCRMKALFGGSLGAEVDRYEMLLQAEEEDEELEGEYYDIEASLLERDQICR
jgi:hypothetical protein